jgi:hypothetical protein
VTGGVLRIGATFVAVALFPAVCSAVFSARLPRSLLLAGWVATMAGCAETGGAAEAVECSEPEQLLTWENWGAGFFAGYCRSCHSAATPDRRGAPASVDFDTSAQVSGLKGAIRSSVLDAGTMPYGGGVPPEELDRLRVFLDCAP